MQNKRSVERKKDLPREDQNEKAYILVIDDDPLLTRTLKKVLEKEGYFVDVAKDGYEGIKKAKSGFFHLVLCDIRMPGLDGLMTIQHIQQYQQKAGIDKSGFIVITAYDGHDTRQRACQLGVTDFLLKPFDLPKFREIIEHNVKPLVRQTPLQEVQRLNERLGKLLLNLDENNHTGSSEPK